MEESTIHLMFAAANESDDPEGRRAMELVAPSLEQLDRIDDVTDPVGTYRLTERTCIGLARLLREIRNSDIAKLYSSQITGSPEEMDAVDSDWFIITPMADMDPAGGKSGLIEVRADQIKGKADLRKHGEHLFVSESFVRSIQHQKLSGLEFVWCPDKGKFAAPQWYRPVATAFLGRGVDHPWFDPHTRGRYKNKNGMIVQPTDPRWVIGVSRFSPQQVREDAATYSPALADLLRALRDTQAVYHNGIEMPPRMLRSFLPETDFAFLRVAEPEPGDARPYRCVQLCCSATARRSLVEGGLAHASDFRSVVVLDAPPKAAAVYDRAADPLPNFPDADALQKIRQAESAAIAKFSPKPPMPAKAPPIAKVISALKKLLKSQGATIPSAASRAAIAEMEKALGEAIPARWKELLSRMNGFRIMDCEILEGALHVASAEELAQMHENSRSMIGLGWPELPTAYLGVATNDFGDAIFLDSARMTADGDCPVIFIDHEECSEVATWAAISIFLSEVAEQRE